MSFIKYCLAALGFLAPVTSGFACTVPTEFPYDPTQFTSDLIIEGITTSTGQCRGDPCADVKVTEIYVGTFPDSTYRLKWWIGGGGMCDPPGPDVKIGQRVRIYLSKESGEFRPQGWVLTNEIPKSNDQIQNDQVIAAERIARQEKYFTVGGALSFNDSKDWLRIEDIPELRGSPGMVLVSFSVSPTGAMEDCTPGHVAKYVALDQKACTIIEKRARLVSPKFPEEASGSFQMYPPEPAEPPLDQSQPTINANSLPILAIAFAVIAALGGLLIWWVKRGKSTT